MCDSVLRGIAIVCALVCCGVLQCDVVCCSVLQCVEVRSSALSQSIAIYIYIYIFVRSASEASSQWGFRLHVPSLACVVNRLLNYVILIMLRR